MIEIFDTYKIWTQVFLVGEPGNLHCKEIAKWQHSEYVIKCSNEWYQWWMLWEYERQRWGHCEL